MVKEEEESPNRPDNTAFTQQRLPAWQPMLSAGIVIPGFVVIGLVFIGIGVALFITSRSITVIEIDYTGVDKNSPCFKCSGTNVKNCLCNVEFRVDTLFEGPLFLYYGLSNYFQNYRKYSASKDLSQLSGDLDNFKEPSEYCAPYDYSDKKPIVPCGAVANSMFNDTFKLYQILQVGKKQVPLDGKGIAWWTDYNVKYRNPSGNPLKNAFNDTVKPPFWPKPAYELDPNDPANNGFINQDFLVWMRAAALPNFTKLYRRITEGDYAKGLPAGNYSLEITYSILTCYRCTCELKASAGSSLTSCPSDYPVLSFEGRKTVVFSNVSWMGGKNQFLGIAYLVIGSLCVFMSIVMLIVYAKFKFPEED